MRALATPPSTQVLLREWHGPCEVDAVLLVRELDRRQKRDGSPFLRLTLADRSGSVPAVLWDVAGSGAEGAETGAPLRVTGRFGEHPRYGRQVTVTELREPLPEQIDWTALLDGPTRSPAELCNELDALLDSIEDADLSLLMQRLLGPDSALGQSYRRMPAAKYNHHAYPHGLLEHSVSIAQLASAAGDIFPGIDRDLAVCGGLLHDIGKLEAYLAEPGCIDLTDAGKLEGEIPLGYYRVRREVETMPGFPPKRAQALLHIVLSHHGRLEYGSPVVPATREAALVHAVDNLSGQLGAFDRLEKETAPDEAWSRYDRVLEGSAFFGALVSPLD